MNLSDLTSKVAEYVDAADSIAELKALQVETQSNLDELQNSGNHLNAKTVKAALRDLKARIVALEEFRRAARHELIDVIDGFEQGHTLAIRENQRARRKQAEDVIGSDEFQGFVELLRGLYFAGNYSSFDLLVQNVIPAHCTLADSEAIARKRDLIIPEPSLPQEVQDAKEALNLKTSEPLSRAA